MYSNCLIEAVKAKLINPRQNKIYKRGSWLEIFQKRCPHFYWYHQPDDKYYCFSPKNLNESWLNQLWYEGEIIEFKWHIGGD